MKIVIGLALALVGCDRTHMHDAYGAAVRTAFAAQIDPNASYRKGPTQQGLDPEEAAIVLDTYRKSLSPIKDAAPANRAPVLILPAPTPGAPGAQPMVATP